MLLTYKVCYVFRIDQMQYRILKFLHETVSSDWDPDLVFYIMTTPETAYERVSRRGRTGEENYSREYIRLCHSFHEDMFHMRRGVGNVITLNGELTTAENVSNMLTYL